ncbi:MAG: tRNA modification GTPase [Phycisphaerales bacterium]
MTTVRSTPTSSPDALGDTIVAWASGHGRSARALIRVSGPQVPRLAERLLPGLAIERGAGRSVLALEAGRTLPVLVVRSPAGRSYTGEESLEVLLPGNPALADRALGAMLAVPGVREANPGEFSARAYLAGRLTLTQAEGVAAIIAAGSHEELEAARRLLRGGHRGDGARGAAFERWSDEITNLLALVEAGIDFADQEDVVPIAPASLSRRLSELESEMAAVLGSRRGSESERWLPTVVLAGRPNAGKSTLFNALLGRRRAITSARAGTTRDVLREVLALTAGASIEVELVDLAGLDEPGASAADDAQGAIDREAQVLARAALREADVVIWCDPKGAFDPRSLPAPRPEAAIIRVRPKADQTRCGQAPTSAEPSDGAEATIDVCALDGFGLGALRERILDAAWGSNARGERAGGGAQGATGGRAVLLPRHRRALLRALHATIEARAAFEAEADRLARPEVVAHHLRAALDDAGELVGRVHPDEVLGRVFATFCVGK